jgi:hypothetical protein
LSQFHDRSLIVPQYGNWLEAFVDHDKELATGFVPFRCIIHKEFTLAVPVDRSHPFIGETFVNHNDFPREAFMEAVLRFVGEDLAAKER